MRNLILALALVASAVGCERFARKSSEVAQQAKAKTLETKVTLGNDKDQPLVKRQELAKDLLDNAETTEKEIYNAALATGCKVTDASQVAVECTTEQILAEDHTLADLIFEAESNWNYLSRVTELGKLMGAPSVARVNSAQRMAKDRVAVVTTKRLGEQLRDMKPLDQTLAQTEGKLKSEFGIVFVPVGEANRYIHTYDVFSVYGEYGEKDESAGKEEQKNEYAMLVPKVVTRAISNQMPVLVPGTTPADAPGGAVKQRTQQLWLDYVRVAVPLMLLNEKATALAPTVKQHEYLDRQHELASRRGAVVGALKKVLVFCESESADPRSPRRLKSPNAPCVSKDVDAVIFEKS